MRIGWLLCTIDVLKWLRGCTASFYGFEVVKKFALPDKCLFFFIPFVQVRSPTGAHGRAASGALHGAMSSPDTSGSTLEQSHSNAATATGECAGQPGNAHGS